MNQINTARAARIVDAFLASGANVGDFNQLLLDNPERADRMSVAAEDGSDGSTHEEAIDDMRENFRAWLDNHQNDSSAAYTHRIEAIVTEHFNALEQWHRANGSLHQEIG